MSASAWVQKAACNALDAYFDRSHSDGSHFAVEPTVVARTAPIPKSPPLQLLQEGYVPPKATPLQLLEQGHVSAAESLVFSQYMERGMQLEQDLTQAKQSFEAAQSSRAFGSDGSHLAVEKAPPLSLPAAPAAASGK